MKLAYKNAKTRQTIDLSSLNERERAFYARAAMLYKRKTNWIAFQSLALGVGNPAYAQDRSHPDILTHPLYRAVKDMFLELGIAQGQIRRKENAECREEDAVRARVVRRAPAPSARR